MQKLPKITVCLLGFLFFSWLRTSIFVEAMDQWFYAAAMRLSYSQLWLRLWYGLTILGSGYFVYAYFLVFVLYTGLVLKKMQVLWFALLCVPFFLLNTGLKLLFALERPVGLASFYAELTTYTYPSGHAFNAVVLCYLLPTLFGGRFKPLFFLPLGLIAFSRVFLGVHWFSDVVGGMLLGWLVCTVLNLLYEKYFKQ